MLRIRSHTNRSRDSRSRCAFCLLVALALAAGGCVPSMNGQPPDPNDGNGTPERSRHERVFQDFLVNGLQTTQDCQICHATSAGEIVNTAHWNWRGPTDDIVDVADAAVGKRNLLSPFTIALSANEAQCTQCHLAYAYAGPDFDFTDPASIDCLVCHDSTGDYVRIATATGGAPGLRFDEGNRTVDADELTDLAEQVQLRPSRSNCGSCHFYADGGDNARGGDLPSDLADPPESLDVHMGALGFDCVTCHTAEQHGIAGFLLHSRDEGGAGPQCVRCHSEDAPHRDNPVLSQLLNIHARRVGCETCHLPAIGRSRPTLASLDWSQAGQGVRAGPADAPTFDPARGELKWIENARPALRWHDGRWRRKVLGANDSFTEAGTGGDPVELAAPVATIADADAKILPFKVVSARMPADAQARRLMAAGLPVVNDGGVVQSFEWNDAVAAGAAAAGQPFSGALEFVWTRTYVRVSHTIPPRAMALGCENCHGVAGFFEALGYDGDPFPDF